MNESEIMAHFPHACYSGTSSPLLPGNPLPVRSPLITRILGVAMLAAVAIALLLAAISNTAIGIFHKAVEIPIRPQLRNRNLGWFRDHNQPSHSKMVRCLSKQFTKTTLKLMDEKPIAALVPGLPHRAFEASAITPLANETGGLIAADNVFDMVRVGTRTPLSDRPDANFLVFWPGFPWKGQSNYEALVWNATGGNFIAIKETYLRSDGRLVSLMYEFVVHGRNIIPGQVCLSDFIFDHPNKGFEGAAVLPGPNGESYLLGLCEGNYCRGRRRGREAGNGFIVIMRRAMRRAGNCVYETVGFIPIPKEAYFQDYSALTIRNEREIAIVSQVDAAVFIGEIRPRSRESGPLFVIQTIGVYNFPRAGDCEIVYCNVEGIMFLGRDRILVVSDKMKGKGKQSFRCRAEDQSVHVFQLP